MNDPQEVAAATDELANAGVSEDGIFVLCGPEGADRLDVSGRRHGLRGRIYRLVEYVSDLNQVLERAAEHMRDGGFTVSVPADEESKELVARIVRRHGGFDIIYYGPLSWEEMSPPGPP
jgi:hypothetical protein